jgi:hypothetical protein
MVAPRTPRAPSGQEKEAALVGILAPRWRRGEIGQSGEAGCVLLLQTTRFGLAALGLR